MYLPNVYTVNIDLKNNVAGVNIIFKNDRFQNATPGIWDLLSFYK